MKLYTLMCALVVGATLLMEGVVDSEAAAVHGNLRTDRNLASTGCRGAKKKNKKKKPTTAAVKTSPPSTDASTLAPTSEPTASNNISNNGDLGSIDTILSKLPPGTFQFNIREIGQKLKDNKGVLRKGFDQCNIPDPERALMIAMAMIETNNMDVNERDASKDSSGGAANVSLFNLSVDLVKEAGFQGDPQSLNDPNKQGDAVCLIRDAIKKFGLVPYLNFVRGGRTAFNDGKSFGAEDYRDTVATILKQIKNNPDLVNNGQRVEVNLVHV